MISYQHFALHLSSHSFLLLHSLSSSYFFSHSLFLLHSLSSLHSSAQSSCHFDSHLHSS